MIYPSWNNSTGKQDAGPAVWGDRLLQAAIRHRRWLWLLIPVVIVLGIVAANQEVAWHRSLRSKGHPDYVYGWPYFHHASWHEVRSPPRAGGGSWSMRNPLSPANLPRPQYIKYESFALARFLANALVAVCMLVAICWFVYLLFARRGRMSLAALFHFTFAVGAQILVARQSLSGRVYMPAWVKVALFAGSVAATCMLTMLAAKLIAEVRKRWTFPQAVEHCRGQFNAWIRARLKRYVLRMLNWRSVVIALIVTGLLVAVVWLQEQSWNQSVLDHGHAGYAYGWPHFFYAEWQTFEFYEVGSAIIFRPVTYSNFSLAHFLADAVVAVCIFAAICWLAWLVVARRGRITLSAMFHITLAAALQILITQTSLMPRRTMPMWGKAGLFLGSVAATCLLTMMAAWLVSRAIRLWRNKRNTHEPQNGRCLVGVDTKLADTADQYRDRENEQ